MTSFTLQYMPCSPYGWRTLASLALRDCFGVDSAKLNGTDEHEHPLSDRFIGQTFDDKIESNVQHPESNQ